MKYMTAIVIAVVVLAGGISFGQEPESNYEHLKCYDQLIGTWVYEGPVKETVEGIVEEGEPILIRNTFRWVLDKNGIEATFYGEVKKDDGLKISAKSLIFWDTAGKTIVSTGLNSLGGHSRDTTTYDASTKTWTTKSKGVDGEGKSLSDIGVACMKSTDTYAAQNLERQGPIFQGDGPEYTFKRVKRPKQPQRLKQAK